MGLFNWLERQIDLADYQGAETVIGDMQERLSTKALAFYIASSYITDTLSKCEIKHYVNGKEVKDKWHYLFNVSPNVNENAFQLKSKFLRKLLYDGHALMFVHKGQLYVADDFNIEPRPLKGNLYTNISLDDEDKNFPNKKAEDVFYLNLDDRRLKALVDGMLEDYSEILKYSFDIFKSSNGEKYKLVLDEIKAGDKDFNKAFDKMIKKQLESFINNRKAVYPQFKGTDLVKLESSNGVTDSTDIRDLRKEIFEITAQAFKMPVSMLYGNMTNVKDIISSYIAFRIEPLAKMISEELTRKTGTVDDYLKGTYFDVDTTSIMHHDIFEIADSIEKLISSGVYNVDNILTKLGEQPLNTEFSKQHWMTKNFDKIENVMNGLSESNETDMRGGE